MLYISIAFQMFFELKAPKHSKMN